jgi:hypothetical protein
MGFWFWELSRLSECKILKMLLKNKRMLPRLAEFFIVGLVMGVTEDIIAISFATDAEITYHTFIVAALVALPFAFISEIIVDYHFRKRRK